MSAPRRLRSCACGEGAKVIEAGKVDATVEKVTDMGLIASRGIISTPALEVDGKIVSTGRIPSETELQEWLGGARKGSCCCSYGCCCGNSEKRARGGWRRIIGGVLLLIAGRVWLRDGASRDARRRAAGLFGEWPRTDLRLRGEGRTRSAPRHGTGFPCDRPLDDHSTVRLRSQYCSKHHSSE